MEVNDVIVDTTKQKMFDINQRWKQSPPFDWLSLLYWLVPILLIIGLAIYLFRRKRKTLHKATTALREAIVALKTLDNSQLLKENKSKEYYSSLNQIVKRYLDRELMKLLWKAPVTSSSHV